MWVLFFYCVISFLVNAAYFLFSPAMLGRDIFSTLDYLFFRLCVDFFFFIGKWGASPVLYFLVMKELDRNKTVLTSFCLTVNLWSDHRSFKIFFAGSNYLC